jgi:hypothetical protein
MLNFFYNKAGLKPELRMLLDQYGNQLPAIRGEWVFFDPNTVYGTPGAYTDIYDAYNALVDERGDGLCLVSSGNSTAETTAYMTKPLDWEKEGVTIQGVCAPIRTFQRARIASKAVTTGSITTIAFPTATTITDSDSGFITAGFKVGQTIAIDTTSNTNDGNAIITAVTAGTITCSASTFTIEDAATAGATTIANYMSYMIDFQASNIWARNFSIGNWLATAQDLGCVKVTGARMAFENVHMIGAGNATPGAVASTPYDLKLDGAEEIYSYGCTFGTDSVAKEAANGEILIDGGCWRIGFENCRIMSKSATAGKVAVFSADASSFSGVIDFVNCRFHNWNENGITAIDDVFGGTGATSGDFSVVKCSTVGYTGWGAGVYNDAPTSAASAAGGISTTE